MTHLSSDVEHVGARLGFCRWCGRAVYGVSFDSPAAAREYIISSLCSTCQDAMFLGGTDGDPYVAGAVRRGAVFAAITERTMAAALSATVTARVRTRTPASRQRASASQ